MVTTYAGGGSSAQTPAIVDTPAIAPRWIPGTRPQPCSIRTADGHHLTSGRAAVTDPARPDRVCVTDLTHPGALLDAFIGRGEHHFLLVLQSGRMHAVELCRSSWQGPGGRLCCFSVRTGLPD